jgi:hypothetical protein
MRPVAHRLARFSAFVLGMVALLAIILATQAPHLAHRLRPSIHLRVELPVLGALAPGDLLAPVLSAAAALLLVAGAGRVLGRRVRQPQPLSPRWPLHARLTSLQEQLRPVCFELLLARDSFAEPYEIIKLADGLSSLLRSRRRLALGRLLGPDSIVLEQRALPAERAVAFYVTAPARTRDAVLGRMRSAYPGLRARPAPADRFLGATLAPSRVAHDLLRRRRHPRVEVDVLRMRKTRRWIWSLQTTKDYAHSTVDSLVHHLHAAGCDAAVQLVLTPAPGVVERLAGRALRRHERDLRWETGAGVEPGIESVTAQKDLKGALEGVGRAYYWFDWRILVPRGRSDVADALVGALSELRQDNGLTPRTIRLRRRLTAYRAAHGLRPLWPGWWSGALSSAEIASAWHLPGLRVKDVELHRQSTRQLAAPAAISRDPHDMLLVDEHGPVGIRPADRRKGLAVLGAPGAGKSALLLRCIGNVARDHSRALILVDPKEDLARDALTVMPASRQVHIIDLHRPQIGLNTLAINELPAEVRADILISAIKEIHGEDSVGARSDSILRAAITAVCTVEDTPTLAHVLRLTDPFDSGYRRWVTRELTYHQEVEHILDFWKREFPAMCKTNLRFVVEALAAPRNKLQRFLNVPSLALATNHPRPVDVFQIIRDREILVVNGSKESIGEKNAALFCQLVVMLVQKALHRLQGLERHERGPCTLIVDEAHNVFTPTFATMLSESRSALLEVVAAWQYTGQITDERVKAGVKSLLQNISITRTRDLDDARAFASLAMELFSDSIRVDADDQRRLTIDPLDIVNAPDHRVTNLWFADSAPQRAFHADTIEVEPVVERMGGREARARHERTQAQRGYHPHDHGRPIEPPLIWSADTPAIANRRAVHVDLTTWTAFKGLQPADVQIVLADSGHQIHRQARPSDSSGRRFTTDVPAEVDAADYLPVGIYRAAVIVTNSDGTQIEWTPTIRVYADGEDEPRFEPATVEITDYPRRRQAAATP